MKTLVIKFWHFSENVKSSYEILWCPIISFMKYICSPFVCDDLGKVLLEGRADEPNEI